MISSMKQVYVEYHLFIVKMHIESAKSAIPLKDLNASCDIELIQLHKLKLMMKNNLRLIFKNKFVIFSQTFGIPSPLAWIWC
jgi:hypothetical protein